MEIINLSKNLKQLRDQIVEADVYMHIPRI
jgi:hypothetical protein